MPDKTLVSAQTAIETTLQGVVALQSALATGDLATQFVRAVALLNSISGRLIVTGVGKSGHIGRKLAATFASTGTPAYFVHATEASHGDLGMIDAKDAILALSWSGETPELANIVAYSQRYKVPLLAITSAANSSLARAATIVLLLPQIREACPHNLTPTTSTILQLAIGDALAVTLLTDKGFTPQAFHVFHPGGKLGAQLKYVRDVMHTGEALPLTTVGTKMSEAIVRMTAAGFGLLAVVDRNGMLAGVISDGDLRRHMSPKLLEEPVEAVMTGNPVVIGADDIAAKALELLQSRKVGALLVVDGGKPVGITRFHDLLNVGFL